MDTRYLFFLCVTTLAFVCVSSRAVNISNTWMLPEEGFPVFYRYFRDRISWYEADAVCQFHHANLVTVDSTSEFDAVRAYLKELDITNNVWIGLSKNGEKSHFTWANFRPLSNEGYWQEAIPVGTNQLCAVADPAADYRWHALPCGGPEAAAFICELPVPLWATGTGGCLLTEIPSLTVLYIPDQSALELTSDCGLDGTKRIACKGNADRDEMMRQLACAITSDDDDDKTTKLPNSVEVTTTTLKTSYTIESEDYGAPTRHRRETENTLSPAASTISTFDLTMLEKGTTANFPETATVSSINDITVGLSITQNTDKSVEITSTSIQDQVTNETSSDPVIKGVLDDATTSNVESGQDNAAEYPAVINQGHLFSIIENGTMFDIIELNETGTEKSTIISVKPESTTPSAFKSLYTTIIYHKEPTEDIAKTGRLGEREFQQEVTPIFKLQEYNDKGSKNPRTMNDLLNEDNDKALTKEIELLPVLPDLSTKLNRTGRKKLPNEHLEDDFVIVDESASHKIVEIKLHKDENNSSHPQLFITTRITDKSKRVEKLSQTNMKKEFVESDAIATPKTDPAVEETKNNEIDNRMMNKIKSGEEIFETLSTTLSTWIERSNKATRITNQILDTTHIPNTEVDAANTDLETEVKQIEIDPKIDILNTENITKNIESESITHLKKQLLPKSLIESYGESDETKEVVVDDPQDTESTISPTGEPMYTIPQQQPKPNRQRLLSKPQRRSFYPYFFSRVLG